ncbi:MAG: helix-turn-helix transcriptional regulator [Bacilli bacterium]|nr:helix-turn-helix transcriptional regulator [Bacilli bacterium]
MAIISESRMFGDIFKELRLEKNLSQDKIAIELDVSQGLIAKWENHQSTPAPEMLDYIADYFNVSTDYLIGRTTMKSNPLDKMKQLEQYKILLDSDPILKDAHKEFIMDFLTEQHKEIDKKINKE